MEGQLLSNKAADVFLNHGGLGYFPTGDLLPTLGLVSRSFQEHARVVFNERLRKSHPSLVLAVESSGGDVGSITWRDWCRFERKDGSNIGDRWNVQLSDIGTDIDVLLEVTKSDGVVVWHGREPLYHGRDNCPKCTFALPHMVLDAPKPRKGDVYGEPDENYPGLTSYFYWQGRNDVSLLQRAICKALHGINVPNMLQVQVVLRRRSTGQMTTVMSSSDPNQIVGEDYTNFFDDDYEVCFCESSMLFQEDDRVGTNLEFVLYHSDVGDTDDSLQFTTSKSGSDEDDFVNVTFRFSICDQVDEDDTYLVLRTLRALKWA